MQKDSFVGAKILQFQGYLIWKQNSFGDELSAFKLYILFSSFTNLWLWE